MYDKLSLRIDFVDFGIDNVAVVAPRDVERFSCNGPWSIYFHIIILLLMFYLKLWNYIICPSIPS